MDQLFLYAPLHNIMRLKQKNKKTKKETKTKQNKTNMEGQIIDCIIGPALIMQKWG